MIGLVRIAVVLADASELDWKHGRPGSAGLVVVALLALALVVLMVSFFKHVKRAQQPWDGDEIKE